MRVTRLHHTGLTVTDLDRSLDFYAGILGFEVRSRRVIDQPWLAQLLGLDSAVVDAVDLAIPGTDQILQLFEFSEPVDEPVHPGMTNAGSVHIAFVVEGLREVHDRLVEAGTRPLAPPVSIMSGANAGGRLLCVQDPDGVVVEFFEAPSHEA